MSATEVIPPQQQTSAEPPALLYMCDFPPSNLGGGPILLSRLLGEYPADTIAVLTSTRFAKVSPREGRLRCEEIAVPLSDAHGRFGLGRLRVALNWLRIPAIARVARRVIERRKISAIVTVLHGQFCFAAAIAARLSRIPYVVIVHDDYASGMNMIGRRLARAVLRGAAHIYCVSPGMRQQLLSEFGADSQVQWPATERPHSESTRVARDEFAIVFAGSITAAVEDSLRVLGELLTSEKLVACGIRNPKLHLYSIVREEQKRGWGWDHRAIEVHPWINQSELARVLRAADILFLPFSFAPAQRHTVETAFPSKTADYLASGTPILVFGPSYSSLVAYAREERFAAIVTRQDSELLAEAIRRIAADAAHRQALSSQALQTFSRHHDIHRQRQEFLQVLHSIVSANSRPLVSRGV